MNKIPEWYFTVLMPIHGMPKTFLNALAAILAKTYGAERREEIVSLTQLCGAAGISRVRAVEALRFWRRVGVIQVTPSGYKRTNRIAVAKVNDTDRLRKRAVAALRKIR